MDTGKCLLMQLRYCINGSRTQRERDQALWWKDKVTKLLSQQPPADPETDPQAQPQLEKSAT